MLTEGILPKEDGDKHAIARWSRLAPATVTLLLGFQKLGEELDLGLLLAGEKEVDVGWHDAGLYMELDRSFDSCWVDR